LGSNDLDDLDLKILKTLLADARSSFTKIAKDCNVATNVIAKRFQRLKRKEIITGTAIITSLPTSELPHRLSVDLKVRSDAINEIIEEYKQNPLFELH
jgi:DNA-binding Lrp family transcriptional regulator